MKSKLATVGFTIGLALTLLTPYRAEGQIGCGSRSGVRGVCADCQFIIIPDCNGDACRIDQCVDDPVINICYEIGQVTFCIAPELACNPIYSGCSCGFGC